MSQRVKKVVFPVAGLGSRFLPATKTVPKEMLPIVDRPLISYAVEEAREAGVEEFIFVTSPVKNAIEQYFGRSSRLEKAFQAQDKTDALELLKSTQLPAGAATFINQDEPRGLGHAIWCAREILGDDPFAVILPDEMVLNPVGCLGQLVNAWERKGGNLVAVAEVPAEHTNRYGIVDPGEKDGNITRIRGLVEKPAPEQAPSRLAITGRYILSKEVLRELDKGLIGAGGEIQLTDAMAATIDAVDYHAVAFEGKRFDCGDKAGYVAANLHYALERPDLGPDVRALLDTLA